MWNRETLDTLFAIRIHPFPQVLRILRIDTREGQLRRCISAENHIAMQVPSVSI